MSTLVIIIIIVVLALLVWWLISIDTDSHPVEYFNGSNGEIGCQSKTATLCRLFNRVMFDERLLMVAYLTDRLALELASEQLRRSTLEFSEFIRNNYPEQAQISEFVDRTVQSGSEYNSVTQLSFRLYDSVLTGDVSGQQQALDEIRSLANQFTAQTNMGPEINNYIDAYMDLYIADIQAIVNGNWVADTEYTKAMFDLALVMLFKMFGINPSIRQ